MAEYQHQEYPKWLYHPHKGGKIFNSAEETKWLWIFGWRDKPYPPKKPGFAAWLKAWWHKWEWFLKFITAILVIIAVLIKFFS